MKKQLLLMMILCLTVSMTWAERIDVATARKVAESVALREGATSGLRSANDLLLVYAAAPRQSNAALRSNTAEDAADYFVFSKGKDNGFIIVAGSDRAFPLLGKTGKGCFDPELLPDNLRYMLDYYQDQINWAENTAQISSKTIKLEWEKYLSYNNVPSTSTGVLLKTAKWGQTEPYNRHTPLIDGKKTYTGCVATAVAIVMRYHKYPDQAIGGVTEYVGKSVTYSPYQWDELPLSYAESYTEKQAEAVAALMWNVGANIKIGYGAVGSDGSYGSYLSASPVLKKIFGYSDAAQYVTKSQFYWNDWKNLLRAELKNGRPVLYDGGSDKPEGSSHAFVCDGYTDGELFHFNWGWNGSYDGYYLLTALDPTSSGDPFSSGMGMVINLRPDNSRDVLSYIMGYSDLETTQWPLPLDEKFTIYASPFNMSNAEIIGKMGIAIIDKGTNAVKRLISNIQDVPVSESQTEDSYWYSSSQIEFSCSLKNPLGHNEKIMPAYSLDNGAYWQAMHPGAEAPLYIDNNGIVRENDVPNDPIVHIASNEFDNHIVHLPNENGYECLSIKYSFLKEIEGNILLRYTLHDYETWKGHLSFYHSDRYFWEPTEGSQVTIQANGVIEIPVDQAKLSKGSYSNYLMVVPDCSGKLGYDIEIRTFDGLTTLGKETGKQMQFSQQVICETSPVSGVVNSRIPFTVKLSNLDEWLIGKKARLDLNINGLETSELKQVNLYRLYDGKRQKLPLGENHSVTFSVDALTTEASYDLEFETDLLLVEHRGINLCAIVRKIDDCSVVGYGRCGNVLVKDPSKPAEVTINHNSFEFDFQRTNSNNIGSISYRFSNLDANKDLLLQYVFKDYESFSGVLSAYQSEDYFFAPEDGIPAEIGLDGIWEIPVEADRIEEQGYLTHYLMFLSDRSGEIFYDIKVLDPNDLDHPIFEKKGNRLFFLDNLSGTIDPIFIEGATGTYIPIIFNMDVEPRLVGKKVALNIKLWNMENISPNDLMLYYEHEGERKEVAFNASWFASKFSVDNLHSGGTYKFILYSDIPIHEDQKVSLAISPIVDDRYGYCQVEDVPVTITGEVTANEGVEIGEPHVWAANGQLHIRSPKVETAYIVTFGGQVYKVLQVSVGEYSEQMPQGSYIIRIGKRSYKLKF